MAAGREPIEGRIDFEEKRADVTLMRIQFGGEVAESAADVDTIMSFGFNWAPPSAIVDLIGAKNIVPMFARYNLMVPPVVEKAADNGGKLYRGGMLDYGRTLVG